jgi:hypothetical protein
MSSATLSAACAQESPNRLGERELVYELLAAVYPKHMFEGVAHGDVGTAMAKTASTVHNDDPLRKNRLRLELSSMRLARGTPFEEGARVLWELEMVDALEAMGVPVLGNLEGFDLDKRKKEMLFTFISTNPDYEEVVKDYFRHIGDYPGMYSHCVQLYSRLKPVGAANGHRGGNRGDGGDSQGGGRLQPARRELGRFADERPRIVKLRQCGARSSASTRSLAKLPMRMPVALPSPRWAKLIGKAGTPRRARRAI